MSFGLGSGYGLGDSLLRSSVAVFVCGVLAIVGGLILYFTFLSPKYDRKFTGFTNWLYQFLNFKKLMIEPLLKIMYVITTLYFTLLSLYLLFSSSFLAFLITFVIANLFARLVYEFLLLVVLICRNTSDINKKMKDYNAVDPNTKQMPSQNVPAYVFCTNCGSKLDANVNKCPNCGTKK